MTPRGRNDLLHNAPIAVLGGTFDPVHEAHLCVARLALEVLRVERLLWLPTGAPEYRPPPVASGADRVAMLRLAIAGEARYAVDERELAHGASGYTVDTLTGLRGEVGTEIPLVLLMGGDQFTKLETWVRWKDLFALAHIAVFSRPGWQPASGSPVRSELEERRAAPEGSWRTRTAGAVIPVTMEPLNISATGIRERLARSDAAAGLLPGGVLDYIVSHRLYGWPNDGKRT